MSYSLCMEDDIDGLECLVRSLRCSLTTSRFSGPFFEMILKHLICYGCNAMIIRNKYKAHLLFKILVSGFIHNLGLTYTACTRPLFTHEATDDGLSQSIINVVPTREY